MSSERNPLRQPKFVSQSNDKSKNYFHNLNNGLVNFDL